MVYRNVEEFISKTLPKIKKPKIFYNQHQRYVRIRAGFDIETTRIETRSYMWCWTVTINDNTCYCRLWSEFERLTEALQTMCRKFNAIMIIWVANLGYEFSYIGKRFSWSKVFAIDAHEPLIARTGQLEFRECLSISGQGGLANLAKNYTKTQKQVGDLDYDKIRVSSEEYCTPTDETEDTYIIDDTQILSEWSEYIFSEYSDKGENIPLTKTGIVKSNIEKAVKNTGAEKEIKKAVARLFPDTKELYNLIMHWLFRGGYTHASAWYVKITEYNVIGADFTSSYPAQMLHYERFPMGEFVPIDLQTDGKKVTDKRLQTMCVYFACNISGIEQTTIHSIESKHKIRLYENAKFDNGRLIKADRIQVLLTEIDYEIYTMFYKWKNIEIKFAYATVRGYLPKYVLEPLKKAYITKARLKAEGKEETIEYKNAKAFINSFYGYTVKRLNFEKWIYNNETEDPKEVWKEELNKKPYESIIKNQVLSPYWGIYVTALARLCLLKNVHKLDNNRMSMNVLYCDTDSIYMKDTPENRAIIEKWNCEIMELNKNTLPSEFHDLGAFDWIGGIDKDGNPCNYMFKTLGTKRYIKYSTLHEMCEVTASGLPKKALENKMKTPFKESENSYILYKDPKHKKGKLGYIDIDRIFNEFDDHLYLTEFEAEKTRAKYNVSEHGEYITDESGHCVYMSEKSSCAIIPVKFSISMIPEFCALVDKLQRERRKPLEL